MNDHPRRTRRRLLLTGAALTAALALPGCGVGLPRLPNLPGSNRGRGSSDGTRCLDGAEPIPAEYEKTVPDGVMVSQAPPDPREHFLRYGLALSPDGARITAHRVARDIRFVASGGIVVWDAADGTISHQINHEYGSDIVWLPDNEHMIVAHPRYASMLSLDGEVRAHLLGHDLMSGVARMPSVAISPDGSRVATLGTDDTVRLFTLDGETCGEGGTLHLGGGYYARAIHWSSDGTKLLVVAASTDPRGAQDSIPQWWDVVDRKLLGSVRGFKGHIFAIALLEDDTVLGLAEKPSAVQVIAPDGAVSTGPQLDTASAEDLIAGPDGKVLITERHDTLLLWNRATDSIEELPRQETQQWCFSPDGTTLYGLSVTEGVMAWDGSQWQPFEMPNG